MNQAYLENGYVVLRNFFAADEIDRLKHVLLDFHRSWQRNNRRNSDDLSSGLTIELAAGDLLVFSTNMIHRGLYGLDRLAFLFFDPELTLVKYVKDDCLPSQAIINTLAHSKIP